MICFFWASGTTGAATAGACFASFFEESSGFTKPTIKDDGAEVFGLLFPSIEWGEVDLRLPGPEEAAVVRRGVAVLVERAGVLALCSSGMWKRVVGGDDTRVLGAAALRRSGG